MEAPGFWDDPDRSNRQMKELKQLKDTVDQCSGLKSQYEDIETLIEMGYEAQDEEMIPEIRGEFRRKHIIHVCIVCAVFAIFLIILSLSGVFDRDEILYYKYRAYNNDLISRPNTTKQNIMEN